MNKQANKYNYNEQGIPSIQQKVSQSANHFSESLQHPSINFLQAKVNISSHRWSSSQVDPRGSYPTKFSWFFKILKFWPRPIFMYICSTITSITLFTTWITQTLESNLAIWPHKKWQLELKLQYTLIQNKNMPLLLEWLLI